MRLLVIVDTYVPARISGALQMHDLAREMLVRVQEEGCGEVAVPGVVPKLSETPGRISNLGPPLGNATYEVMRELLDLSAGQIAELRQRKII